MAQGQRVEMGVSLPHRFDGSGLRCLFRRGFVSRGRSGGFVVFCFGRFIRFSVFHLFIVFVSASLRRWWTTRGRAAARQGDSRRKG